ncbi:MAG: helix-turn-helix transcriptional regulator [Thermoguttaceae bacterium]
MPSKNPPSVRQLNLIELLKKTKIGVTFADIADTLGMDTRTIQRDMVRLKKTGLPIEVKTEAHGLKRWKIKDNQQMPTAFNFDEAAAFYLGYRFLAPLSNSFIGKSAKLGLRKIREQLGTQHIRLLNQLLEVFRESTTGWSDYSQHADIIATLITACNDKKETVIRYRSYSAKKEQMYTIHPYTLVSQMGTIYVLGFSEKRNEIRTWKLNRITAVERQKATFKKPSDAEIDAFRRKGFGVFVFNNKPVEKVKIKVDGVMARFVQEHNWHETQKFTTQNDGSVMVQFEVVPTRELTNWILQLGCNAEVLKPKSLREEVAAEIAKMNKRYEDLP